VADAELKNGRWGGHLHGVPIAVKELFDVENLPATYGSQERTGVVVAADCEVVRLTWAPLSPNPDSVLQLTVLQLAVSRQTAKKLTFAAREGIVVPEGPNGEEVKPEVGGKRTCTS
jgi:Amidase